MIKSKTKLIISAIVFTLVIIAMQLSIYATNENVEIVKKSSNDYLIYIKDNLDTDFSFAFSNNKNEDKALLTFKKAETDSTEEGMTMFRWRCTLLQWGIISGNTTNER